MEKASPAKRIAKNTFFLYLRSFILLAISIYSSRVVLDILGVEDFGIYNLVGGVVALFSSLKVVFSAAIQRFLNYTRGLGDEEGVRHIFNLSVIIQLLLALGFAILVEAFGLWFIPNKLDIPDEMLGPAMFVFHCSIATSVISIIGVPYNAVVIANERMNFYAYVSIAEAIIKLGAVFLLPFLPFLPLRSYAVLILLCQTFMLIVNYIYCRQFSECKFEKYWDRSLFQKLASFSGWNFFGNLVFSLVNEGINIVLNLFGGLVANAARGIMMQIRNAIENLSSNLYLASQPYVMQQAATMEKEKLFNYIFILSRVIFYVILITVAPIIVYTEQILGIWLIQIPQYTVEFVRMILLFELVRCLHAPIEMLFLSEGRLKRYQLTEFVVLVISLPLSYTLLYYGLPLYSAYLAMTIVEFANLFAILFVAKKEMGLKVGDYVFKVLQKCALSLLIVSLAGGSFYYFTHDANKILSLIWIILLALVSASLIYVLILSEDEKKIVKGFINKKARN